MRDKSKIVTIGERRYQVGRFLPDVGSFILMKILGMAMKASAEAEGPVPENVQKAQEEINKNSTGEDKVRSLAGIILFSGNDFDFHKFVQSHSMDVCSRMESSTGSVELPMPITNGKGAWAIPEIRDDISLVMRLTIEALVFNLSDFFDQGGMEGMIGKPDSSQ